MITVRSEREHRVRRILVRERRVLRRAAGLACATGGGFFSSAMIDGTSAATIACRASGAMVGEGLDHDADAHAPACRGFMRMSEVRRLDAERAVVLIVKQHRPELVRAVRRGLPPVDVVLVDAAPARREPCARGREAQQKKARSADAPPCSFDSFHARPRRVGMVPPAALCLKEFQGRDREEPFQSLREIWPELQRAGAPAFPSGSLPASLPLAYAARKRLLRPPRRAQARERMAAARPPRPFIARPASSGLFHFLQPSPYFLPPEWSAHM